MLGIEAGQHHAAGVHLYLLARLCTHHIANKESASCCYLQDVAGVQHPCQVTTVLQRQLKSVLLWQASRYFAALSSNMACASAAESRSACWLHNYNQLIAAGFQCWQRFPRLLRMPKSVSLATRSAAALDPVAVSHT